MRGRGLLLVLGVMLVSGCSGRPNDLSDGSYYADAQPAAQGSSVAAPPSSSAPATGSSTSGTPSSAAPSRSEQQQDGQRVARALLTESVLGPEGFKVVTPARPADPRALPACVSDVDLGRALRSGRQADWQGVRTAVPLVQYVGAADKGSAADLVRRARRVTGCATEVPLAAGAGVDAQVAWCEKGRPACRVLVAKGSLLTDLEVAASTEARSRELLTQLAPKAVEALNAR
ncbi:hypothetical protein [Streptoalloteichus tenebrarius]|uniref:hypothetical protein n=1 Tax=Streptoalloteichus tenebrarius (strain ATCC 17920 / DSM 40477 / JCM 4838 / CBS 697.72 / NBRC 16177 / NCIMB 11028 / NRRL B-12390 / A12253. 1 / ISP 5477) TaxID=1933 RepID=UPI0020A2A0E9|nr:hypothetical protein [Streptoalloteichus tenebrarius]